MREVEFELKKKKLPLHLNPNIYIDCSKMHQIYLYTNHELNIKTCYYVI